VAATGGSGNVPQTAAAHKRMTLDVVVTDKAAKLVSGLEPTDFTLLDNNEPRKVLGFRRTDGVAGSRIDPPVEVILVVDVLDLPYQAITFQRLQLDKFLRSNGGKLSQPTSLFVLSNKGLSIQPEPSTDGNAIAAVLDKTGAVRAMDASAGFNGQAEQFDKSTRALLGIAENEARKPGRKILIWVGHGWPVLHAAEFHQTNESLQIMFHTIVALENQLREARITVYGLFTLVGENARGVFEAYLKPVTEARKADPANLALQVLALHSGGRILDPTNDVAGQLASCVADIGPYYTLIFEQPRAAEANEYHKLTVRLSQPGLNARTNVGYYNQP
jgi:VWFA-related protein